MKARDGTSIEDRCRINVLALAAVALSQVHHWNNLSYSSQSSSTLLLLCFLLMYVVTLLLSLLVFFFFHLFFCSELKSREFEFTTHATVCEHDQVHLLVCL